MIKNGSVTTRRMMQTGLIAAIYATLTIALAPISYGPLQVRVSESLTVLPALTPAAVPGVFIGCLIANIIGPYGAVDVILGSVATLVSAILSAKLKSRPILVPLPPVIINGIVIGSMLHFVYGMPGLFACMGWVALGQTISCYGIGYPLMKILKRYEGILK